MKFKRTTAIGATIAAAVLILSGCAAPGAGEEEILEGTTITAVQNQPFYCFNANTAECNSTYNSNVAYMMSSSFNYYDNSPALVKNELFGTYTVDSEDPLTVTYTIADGVTWSDGVAVDAADLLLNWVSGITKYNDPEGVNFTSAVAGGGLDLVSQIPEMSDDGKSITLVYDQYFVDWETNFGVGMPAHITYQEAFPDVTDAQEAKDALVAAIQGDDTEALTSIATAWATSWVLTAMPTDEKLLVTNGPYTMSDYVEGEYVTLTAVEDYIAGPKPKVQTITVRFISDPTAQVQALQNGDASLIYGQATADTVAALEDLEGVTSETTLSGTYEHIDLTFNNGGPFDPATYGGDAEKAKLVRQAFMKVIPRQEIIDKLITPLTADATTADSQTILPGAPGYDESVAANGSADYAEVDVAAAQALLEEAGVSTPIDVQFMYGKSNTRRANEFALIQAAAEPAGFNVIDAGNDDWGSKLQDGTYDAVLFAWAFTSLAVTSGQSILQTGGGSNFNGYSSTVVDEAYEQLLAESDPATQQQLLGQIDAALWADGYGVTLFQHPDVSAWSSAVTGVSYSPLVPNIFWSFWEWETTDVETSTPTPAG